MLNNHGWSIKEMLLYISILLIALFFSTFFILQLKEEFGESFKEMVTGKITYATIERNLEQASIQYIQKFYGENIGNSTIIVLSDNLVSYDILKESDLITSDKDICKGYALIRKSDYDYLDVQSYIICNQYKTKEFQDWRME